MKKYIAAILMCLVICGSLIGASAQTKSTSNTNTQYSWVGIKIFSIGVEGWYDSNGSRVTSFGKTTARPQCYYMWTNSNKAAWWTSTANKKQAQCYGQAKFCLGVTTDAVTIGVQSGYWGVTATGRP